MFSFKPPSHYSQVVFLKNSSIFQDADCCFLKPLGIFISEAREGALSWTDIVNCLNRTVAPFGTFHKPSHIHTVTLKASLTDMRESTRHPEMQPYHRDYNSGDDGNSRILFVLTARWTLAWPKDQLTLVRVHSTLSLLSFTSHFLKNCCTWETCDILLYPPLSGICYYFRVKISYGFSDHEVLGRISSCLQMQFLSLHLWMIIFQDQNRPQSIV